MSVAPIYHDRLSAIGLFRDTLLTEKGYKGGKFFLLIDFEQEQLENVLPLEKSGNLRITLTFGETVPHNRLIFLFGDTTGVLAIDKDRQVLCEVRA